MKKLINSRVLFYVSALFIGTLLLASCKKDSVTDPNSRVPAAGLMAFNLVPEKTVGFALNGNNLSSGMFYTSFTGVYLPVYPGTREVRSFDASNGTTLAISSQVFKDSAYYSAFSVGYNGSYRNVVVKDELDSLPSEAGQAYVRYINAITDSTSSPTVSIIAGGTTLINTSSAYAKVSGFVKVPAGDIVFTASNAGDINTTRTINVESKKIYTILLIGDPASANSDKAVQVKFITNGIIE